MFSQNIVPPQIKFESLKENWVYISKDENYNDYFKSIANSNFTPYSLKNCRDIKVDSGNLYILENTLSPSPFLGNDGFLLHKINKSNGNKLWVHHNNFMSGNKYRELYWNNKIMIDTNGNIILLGYRDIDTINFNFPKFSFYGNPIERTINSDGKIVKLKYGNSKTRNLENVAQANNPILKLKDGRYYHCLFEVVNSDEYIENLKCYPLNNNFEIKNDSFISFAFYSELEKDAIFSLEYQKSFIQMSDDSILTLTLFGTSNKEISPENAKITWLVLKSDSLVTLKILDISKDIFKPQDLSIFHQPIKFQILDDYIVLSQIISVNDSNIDAKFLTWILVYDKDGNLIVKPNLIYNKIKNYTDVKVLKIDKSKMFLGVQMDDGKFMGSEILEVNISSGNFKRVGNIITAKNSNYQIGNIVEFKDLNNGNAVVNIPLELKQDQKSSTIRYYYSFKMSDLGIYSTTQSLDFIFIPYSITPNPSSHQITVTLPEINNAVTLHITDQVGRSVWVQDISDTETSIDVSGLASGMYFVSLQDAASGRQLGKVQKLVKVE